MTELVYLIGGPESHLAKIGRSGNITQRLGAIQRMCPIGLSVLWNTEGGHKLETALHRVFHSRRVHGEWFDFTGCDPLEEVPAAAAVIKAEELRPIYGASGLAIEAVELAAILMMSTGQTREVVGQLRQDDVGWYRRARNGSLKQTPCDVARAIIVRAVADGKLTASDLRN